MTPGFENGAVSELLVPGGPSAGSGNVTVWYPFEEPPHVRA